MTRKTQLRGYYLLLWMFILFCHNHIYANNNDISLFLTVNKKTLHSGENLLLCLEISNNSNKKVSISSWKFKDIILNRMFFDAYDKLLPRSRKFKFDWGRIGGDELPPLKDDFISLNPLQKRKLQFKYTVKRSLKVTGLAELSYNTFLENEQGDYVTIGANKKIIIQGNYKPNSGEIINGKYYGFENVYDGEVTSNKVEISIK